MKRKKNKVEIKIKWDKESKFLKKRVRKSKTTQKRNKKIQKEKECEIHTVLFEAWN